MPEAHPTLVARCAATWRELWPWIVAPPLAVSAVILWLWMGAEGGLVEAGRYTLS